MKTRILAGLIISGVFAASAAQAAGTYPTIEEIYSGMGVAKIEQIKQIAAQQATSYKATCNWHEAKNTVDSLQAAYPGDEYTEKAYLTPANQNFVC